MNDSLALTETLSNSTTAMRIASVFGTVVMLIGDGSGTSHSIVLSRDQAISVAAWITEFAKVGG